MAHFFNIVYITLLLFSLPWFIYKACTTGKYRRGLWSKLLGLVPWRNSNRPCVWFHGVSVGEIHLLRQVVARFRAAHPDHEIVVSTTTYTGLDEAKKHFPDQCVFYWPFDFTWAIQSALHRIKPKLIVLAESEIWPNFLSLAKRAGVTVAVINGRFSPRSFRRYRRFRLLARWLLQKVDLWGIQTHEYGENLQALGIPLDRIKVTGSVKYDGVDSDRHNTRTDSFRELFSIAANDLVWVCGSTQPPEEEMALDIFQQLKGHFPSLRLILVPRQKERFSEVAEVLQRRSIALVRRSHMCGPVDNRDAVILVDSIGELNAIWGLADIAFVGGSFDGRRGGQNMIEPAAYGAAVLFGPHTWNFKETVSQLLAHEAAIQVESAETLQFQVSMLLRDAALRQTFGKAAQRFVQSQQGATEKTIELLGDLLNSIDMEKLAA